MTGIIFAHFASVCTGKLTNFNASYWQDVANTFDKDTPAYLYKGATGRMSSCRTYEPPPH
jgi:hypothetical protein